MSSVPTPLDPTGTAYEEIPARDSPASWLFLLLHGAVGVVSIGLAASPEFAAGKAAFAGDEWRFVLGVAGAFTLFLAARGLYRKLTGYVVRLTPEFVARGRRNGIVLLAIGAWFLACRYVEAAAYDTMALASWARPFYAAAGTYLVLVGLVQQQNPTSFIRKGRVMRGQGIPGRGTILRFEEPGFDEESTSTMIEITFEIDAANRTYEATGKFLMERDAMHLLVPGATAGVVVNPTDPQIFHVDWRTWRRPL
ncbi:MAG TPA: hypothetical protein VHI71_02440 [Actinomycetota bacterium]|nr:hypothetical protein [Actinomycetota bacterium]